MNNKQITKQENLNTDINLAITNKKEYNIV